MPFRTLLALASPDLEETDLTLAADLAAGLDAHLSILAIGIAIPPPVGDYGAVGTIWLDQRATDLRALERYAGGLTRWLAERGLRGDVATEFPDLADAGDVIGRRSRYADLMIAGPALLSSELLKRSAIEGAVFSSDKPLLVVPAGSRATLRPRKVMVAWDARLEASRAVREALDMLVAAEVVHLVMVDPVEGDEGHGEEPGADAAAFLARHGVNIVVDRLPGGSSGVGGALRRHAVDCGAELIVMGAYGHSRLRERLFGGVTRSMLTDSVLPLFLAR